MKLAYATVFISVGLIIVAISNFVFTLATNQLETPYLLTWLTLIAGLITLFVSNINQLNEKRSEKSSSQINIYQYLERLRKDSVRLIDEDSIINLPMNRDGKSTPQEKYALKAPEIVTEVRTQSRGRVALAILGNPGSGKSITLRQIALGLIDDYEEGNSRYFPFYIDLSDPKNPYDTEKLIEYCWREKEKISEDYEDLMHRKRIVFLLDGLNEMPNLLGNRSFEARLKNLRHFFNNEYLGSFIVTCRTADFENYKYFYGQNLQLNVEIAKIIDLPAQSVRLICNQVFGQHAPRFIEKLTAGRYLRHRILLAQNAYALKMMIDLFQSGNNALPHEFQGLYSRYFKRTYRDYTKGGNGKRTKVKRSLEKLEEEFNQLAVDMFMVGIQNANRNWSERMFRRGFFGTIPFRTRSQMIKDGLHLGFLEESDVTTIKFIHQTWYEYFALPSIDLSDGNLNWKIRVVETMGKLGSISKLKLNELLELYSKESDQELKRTCQNAIIRIAMDLNTRDSAIFVLSLILDATIELYNDSNYIFSGKFKTVDLIEILKHLKINFELCNNMNGNSIVKTIETFRARRHFLYNQTRNTRSEDRKRKLLMIDDEIMYITELRGAADLAELKKEREELLRSTSDETNMGWMQGGFFQTYLSILTKFDDLLTISETNKADVRFLIVNLKSFVDLLHPDEIIDTKDTTNVNQILLTRDSIRKQIVKSSTRLQEHAKKK